MENWKKLDGLTKLPIDLSDGFSGFDRESTMQILHSHVALLSWDLGSVFEPLTLSTIICRLELWLGIPVVQFFDFFLYDKASAAEWELRCIVEVII